MSISNIQLGVDLATALSVLGASFAYIREIQRNRRAEQLEQQKARSLRKNQFKLEKASEVINYLSSKEAEMQYICDQIDLKLRLIESPEDIDSFVVKLSDEESKYILNFGLEPNNDHRFIPDEFKVSGLIKDLLKSLRDTASYLRRNPYIEYLLDDDDINEKVSKIISSNEYHGTIANKGVSQRKTLYMRINEFENHPFALGGYLYDRCQSKHKIMGEGQHVQKTLEELGSATRNITNRERIKQISKAYQADYFELESVEKKAKIYRSFVIHRIENQSKKRHVWNQILDELNDTIKSLAEYSYTTISDPDS